MTAQNNTRLGILLMGLTALFLAVQDGISRHLADAYNVYQVVMIRYWVFAAFVIVLALQNKGLRATAKTAFPRLQILRGVVIAAEVSVTVLAFTLLGLTETHAIFMCFPLLIVAFSGPLLGETVGWQRKIAICIGLLGVIIILKPGDGVFSPYAILPCLGALLFAGYSLLTRYVASDDSADTSFFYTGVVGCVVMTIIGVFHWQPIQSSDVVWLILLSTTSLCAHWLLIKTYDVAEASAVQPFAYLQLPFAAIIGVYAFAESIRLNVWIGATIVVGAGVFTFWRERKGQR